MAAAQPLQPGGRPLSRAMADRLRTTLLAAAGNEELSEALEDGRLALEAEAGGAWPPPDASDAAAAPRAKRAAKPTARTARSDRRIVTDTNKRAKRAAAKTTERDEEAEREREREREAREAARRERDELERQLRDARGTLK